jgi:2-aminoadipate transaminase
VRPAGGIYVWVELPQDCVTGIRGPLVDLAVKSGMLYVPGEYFFPPAGEPVQQNFARLSFGVPSEERLRSGVEAFAHATQSYLSNANC